MPLSRREFVSSAAAVAAGAYLGETMSSAVAAQNADTKRPIGIGSANAKPSLIKAVELIRGGDDPLDSVISGVNIVEDDPTDHSVGYGGLPNEDGVVELDSCVMDGRYHKAGGVASLQRIKNPSRVAALVMRRTDHVLLVGEGALRFARAHGFKEQDLLTDEAREIWLKWKETHSDNDDWIRPEADKAAAARAKGIQYTTGTITCMALTATSDLVGCTSTSGLSYKLPGRVGDSPIIGAGLYVDNEVGACGSTGRGEANLQNLSSFAVVELMRGGMTPDEACMEALRRVAKRTEKRLRNAQGEPAYGLTFYAIRKDGMVGGAAMREATNMAYHDGAECKMIKLPQLYGG